MTMPDTADRTALKPLSAHEREQLERDLARGMWGGNVACLNIVRKLLARHDALERQHRATSNRAALPVAHRCGTKGGIRPYPGLLCSLCRGSDQDLTVRELVDLATPARAVPSERPTVTYETFGGERKTVDALWYISATLARLLDDFDDPESLYRKAGYVPPVGMVRLSVEAVERLAAAYAVDFPHGGDPSGEQRGNDDAQ